MDRYEFGERSSMGDGDSLFTAVVFLAIGLWVALEALPLRNSIRWTIPIRAIVVIGLLGGLFAIDVRVPWPLLVETSLGVGIALVAFGIYDVGRWTVQQEDNETNFA